MLEIQKTFDFFKTTAASDRIDRIILSGGASRAEGFTESLAERFEAPVEPFDPFRKIAFDAKKFKVDAPADMAPTVAVAVGLGAAPGERPMIRINLLAVERERDEAPARGHSAPAQRVTIGATLILLATALGIGWWFWSLRTAVVSELDAAIARAETETQQLRSVLGQVQKFETRKAQLQQRVTLIEQLRRGQTGPVHVLDEVSKSVPDRLWLTSMVQKDKEFTIDGRTTSLTALSDFVANIEGEHLVQAAGGDRRQPGRAERRRRAIWCGSRSARNSRIPRPGSRGRRPRRTQAPPRRRGDGGRR